jgi:hypothetical protein
MRGNVPFDYTHRCMLISCVCLEEVTLTEYEGQWEIHNGRVANLGGLLLTENLPSQNIDTTFDSNDYVILLGIDTIQSRND